MAGNKKVAANKKKMLLQIKKLLQIKSCMTRQATWKLVPSLPLVLGRMADDRSEKQIIEGCFHQGYQNDVSLEFLSVYHNITISLSTLKRCLRAYGLRREHKKNARGDRPNIYTGVKPCVNLLYFSSNEHVL